jgi:hypothetical protein
MASSGVAVILGEVKLKEELEGKAFAALGRRLEPTKKICGGCKGAGCPGCDYHGFVMEEVDMRAIELVLGPKFPRTSINVNADLDGMSTGDLLSLIEGM